MTPSFESFDSNNREKSDTEMYRDIFSKIDALNKPGRRWSEAREAFASAMEELSKASEYEEHAFDLQSKIDPSDPNFEYKKAHTDSVELYAKQKKRAADALVDLSNILLDEGEEAEKAVI